MIINNLINLFMNPNKITNSRLNPNKITSRMNSNKLLKMNSSMKKTAKIVIEMIDFLEERGYKPIFVFPPMSESLYEKIPSQTLQYYVYDFLKLINKPEVPFLDYSQKEELRNNKYFFNSLFMNLEGRRIFTRQVLEDLKLK